MSLQEVTKTEKTDFQRDFQENSSNYKFFNAELLAPGVGFEPTRPFRATG